MTITIREALQLPDMVQTRLVGGAEGLDNPIRWVTIVEVLEDVGRLQEGEFLITTGFGLAEDAKRRASLIPALAKQKLSGIAFHTGFYLREIPVDLIEMADRHHLPLIEIPVEMNFSTITKAILQPIVNRQFETLAYSQAIHRQMIEAALSKGGLRAIVEKLASLTGGRVSLTDALGFKVYGNHEGDAGQQADRSGKDQEKEQIHTVEIRAHREKFGTLRLAKPREEWKDLDDVALQHAATLCAMEYIKENAVAATEWRLKGDFVEELLSGTELAPAELESRCRMLGYPLSGAHFVAAVQVEASVDRSSFELHQACITLMKRLFDSHNRPYLLRERPHSLFFIMPHDQTSLALLEQFAARWDRLHREHDLRIGLSSPRGRLTELDEAVQEALFALQAYPLLVRSPALLSYQQMQGYQFLFPYHHKAEMLEAIWKPFLEPLLRYDQKHKQQLLETLDMYLMHNGNGLQTSQALYIHRHTLTYRLAQIREKTGCDLDDAHQRWQLQLALMARRLQEQLFPPE
ncbi:MULTISPECIES: PucR family transcriptional regulator [Brevibacillus]|jgi:purine catabolism regulator|uniref:PucR family transcriptional regulator n=1 Tax=Brevibacillus TaxID=55080 RepID=UPI0004F2E509|nr:PucR family transcriptional regulator [Brevibacillus borstelensis]KKX56673.1 transcriptional regulator [Brevibacillus borstelensis cifa_chp40]MCC0565324.1 PucR family transcriptional regulator ligand-binding domain-containing protein [Brevibacillus borstelensis]MCM3470821.1 PucR family transcriptional regulator ligand-binding domain-containing protein [Brevibacillus borstelensis]MCM3559402.1 PucR family transcriptional regulator ligand-binding domain-containing protein [Brevibacillus borstel